MAWAKAKTSAGRDQHKGNAMRIAAGLIFASAVSLCTSGVAWSQTAAPKRAAAPQAALAPAAAAAPPKAPCANPNALGIARIVAIDTTRGPGVRCERFQQLDVLREPQV